MEPPTPEQVLALYQDLQNVKMQLAQQQQASAAAAAAAAPRAPTLKPAKPETFDASKAGNRADNWLFQLNEYFNACNVHNDLERVAYAGAMLRGAAATWWRQRRTYAASGAMADITIWSQFCNELRTQFTVINAEKIARDQLAALKQTGAVQSYAIKFRDITIQIPDITDKEKMDRFVRGLKPRLQHELAIHEPPTLDDAIRLAERIDAVDFSWQQRGYRTPSTDHHHSRPEPMELGYIETKPLPYRADADINSHSRALRPNLDSKPPAPYRKPLTDEDRQRLRKAGACFKCRKTGHLARDCPETSSQLSPNAKAQ